MLRLHLFCIYICNSVNGTPSQPEKINRNNTGVIVPSRGDIAKEVKVLKKEGELMWYSCNISPMK